MKKGTWYQRGWMLALILLRGALNRSTLGSLCITENRLNSSTKLISLALFVICFGLMGAFGCSGGASSSPPASIPAPVAGLITVTSPNSEGLVRVQGAPEAVLGDAQVTVVARAPVGVLNMLIASAYADSSVTVTAEADGSFVAELEAAVGDEIEVTQGVDGDLSVATDFDVGSGSPEVVNTPVEVTTLQVLDYALVASQDGSDSYVDIYDMLFFTFEGTYTVEDFVVSAFDVDESTQELFLISQDSQKLLVLDGNTGDAVGDELALDNPHAVVVDSNQSLILVGHESELKSVSLIVVDADQAQVETNILLNHPTDGGATHEKTRALSVNENDEGDSVLAVLSLFDNGDTILSYLTLSPPPAAAFDLEFQVNLGSGTFSDVALGEAGTMALVSHTDDNELMILRGNELGSQTTVSVGQAPKGVATLSDEGVAFVANSASHTVSVVDLDSDLVEATLTTADGIGLGPEKLALDDDPFVLFVLNELSQSVSLLVLAF